MKFIEMRTNSLKGYRSTKTKRLNILVVDDKEYIRSLLKRFLANYGHTVITVDRGKVATEILKTETFDMVLTDIVMPEMSGYELISELNKLVKRPVIGVITGWSEDFETKEKNELKVDFILQKPFKLSVLSKYMNEAFNAVKM